MTVIMEVHEASSAHSCWANRQLRMLLLVPLAGFNPIMKKHITTYLINHHQADYLLFLLTINLLRRHRRSRLIALSMRIHPLGGGENTKEKR